MKTPITNLLSQATFEFQKGKPIGSGTYGSVYEAYDPQLGADLAVKIIPISSFSDVDAYFREARMLYLTRHHNIAQVNYAGKDQDFVYLMMPHYRKGSMKSLIDTRFLTVREIIRYSIQFLSGLNNIHVKGLLHFDLKLENLLISDNNQALVSDFGLAQSTDVHGNAEVLGTTIAFAPPEFFTDGHPIKNFKYDIYQAGFTMYRMCNGDKMLEQQYHDICKGNPNNIVPAIIKGDFPDRSAYHMHIPKPLRSVINKALNIDLNIRYDSIIDMLNQLSSVKFASDWQMKQTLNGNEWDNPDYTVREKAILGAWEIECRRKSTGNRVTKYCAKVFKESEKKTLLYNCLGMEWK
ncbi:MAG TPA: serine/threonine-protein kinase [Pyrinomonadaceae bacterium]|nr:serine/threonine-protein kinase [Pyrinomonadaceae bacterium]